MSSCINMRAVVIMLLLIAHFTLVAAQDPIYVLDMMSAISTTPAEASINLGFNEALRVGILAAMTAANFTTTNGQEIILIPTNLTSSSDAVAALEAALADPTTADLITVYGPVGDDPLQALMSSSALLDHDLTCFAPVTGSRQVRAAWSPHVYFTFASPTVHFLNVLQYIVGTMAVRRIGMIYFDGSQFGPLELESLNTQLASIDYDPAIVLSPPLGAPLDMNLINEFLEKEPQAVLISSFSSDSLRILMQAILLDPRSSGVPFFSTTLTEYALTELYADLVAAGSVVAEANKLVFASNSPSPYDLSVSFISRFQQEVHAYEQHPLLFGHSASLYNPHYAEVMLIGWTSAKLLLRTLNDPQWTSSRASYMSELFDQRQYLLEDDLVYGDYGGNCSASAVASGAVCSCNSGGRQSFLKFLDQTFNFSMTEHSVVSIPRTQCLVSTTGALLHQSTAFFLVSTNDAVSQYISAAMFAAARAASSITVSGIDGEATVHLAEVSTTSSQYQATFNTRLRNFREDIVLGMLPAYVSATDILVLDPVSPQAVVAAGARNSIFLMPTLRQQLYVFAAYQAQVKPSAIHAILRSTEAEVIREVLEASLETFELDLDSSTLLRETAQMDVLGERLPTSGTIFFTGATNRTAERDLTFLMEQVASYPQLQVVMSFDDVASNYNILLPILDVADDATLQRIFFCTSLPHWGDALSTSESVQRYHTLITDPLEWSPRSMQGYVVEQFAKRVLILSSDRSYASLLRSIYSNQNFMVDDLFFGQYMDDCDEMHESCVPSNYGATNIRVWSFARITNPQVPVTFGPLTPVLTYTSRAKSSKLSTGAIVGITVGVVAAIAIFIIILLLVCCCCCCNGTRQQSNAPAKPSEPLTLLFTDIEASTTLWSTIPQFMPEALSAHHRIIRQLIVKHHCYEVKTIGDSFMIAAKNPYTAALLAQDIQHALFRHDWKSTNCDQIYLNMEEDMAEMDADFILTATTLEAKTYAEQWSGLRVRIGIHTGICTIRDDHVTHGFDYSGDTALIASHTEALGHGGQVVLTSHAWFAMTEAERQTLRISRLGPHRIRGSPQPINFYQLNTVPGRTFRPLRVEQTLVEENDDSEAMTDPFCEGIPLTGPAEILSTVLSASFSPFTPLQRIGELQTLLRRWQSEVPHQPRDQTNLDYSNGLLRRMVVHLAQQLDPKEAIQLLRPTRGEHSKVLHASPSITEESRADPATLRCDQQQYTVAGTHGPSTGPEPTTDSADGPPSSTERADSKAPEPAQRQLGQSQSFEPLQAIGLHPAHRPMPHPASIDTIFLE